MDERWLGNGVWVTRMPSVLTNVVRVGFTANTVALRYAFFHARVRAWPAGQVDGGRARDWPSGVSYERLPYGILAWACQGASDAGAVDGRRRSAGRVFPAVAG